jgi:hypothetical protein
MRIPAESITYLKNAAGWRNGCVFLHVLVSGVSEVPKAAEASKMIHNSAKHETQRSLHCNTSSFYTVSNCLAHAKARQFSAQDQRLEFALRLFC